MCSAIFMAVGKAWPARMEREMKALSELPPERPAPVKEPDAPHVERFAREAAQQDAYDGGVDDLRHAPREAVAGPGVGQRGRRGTSGFPESAGTRPGQRGDRLQGGQGPRPGPGRDLPGRRPEHHAPDDRRLRIVGPFQRRLPRPLGLEPGRQHQGRHNRFPRLNAQQDEDFVHGVALCAIVGVGYATGRDCDPSFHVCRRLPPRL